VCRPADGSGLVRGLIAVAVFSLDPALYTLPVLYVERADGACGYGGLVNLLTGERKGHIIDTKDRCGPGQPLGQPHIYLLDGLLPVPEHKLVSLVIAAPGAGVAAWKRYGRYPARGSGRRVYRLP
jgi:hypothetical protein